MNKLLSALLCLLLSSSALAVEAPAPKPESAPAARIIYLVRHGNYVADPKADEKLGPGLSPIGVAQAHLAGARLSGLPIHFDALYASPMQRARDTAALIGEDFPGQKFEVINDLAECTPPTRQSKIMEKEKPEDVAECKAKLDRIFTKYFVPAAGAERNELFVCHGNVIRYLVTRALGVDTLSWLEMSVGHASITKIRVQADGSFKIIAVGDVGHLPPNLLTGASGDKDLNLSIPVLPVLESDKK